MSKAAAILLAVSLIAGNVPAQGFPSGEAHEITWEEEGADVAKDNIQQEDVEGKISEDSQPEETSENAQEIKEQETGGQEDTQKADIEEMVQEGDSGKETDENLNVIEEVQGGEGEQEQTDADLEVLQENKGDAEQLSIKFSRDDENVGYCQSTFHKNIRGYTYLEYDQPEQEKTELNISSSNDQVVKITSKTTQTVEGRGFFAIAYQIVGVGIADIIVSAGSQSCQMRFYIVPELIEMKSVEQTSYNSATVEWKSIPGCTGYRIERSKSGKKNYQTVTTVQDGSANSAVVQAKWNVEYTYRVIGLVEDSMYRAECEDYDTVDCTVKKIGAELVSVKKSGSSKLAIKWNVMNGANGYKLYRSTSENGTYKCVYTAKSRQITSWKQKVKKGETYYYKLKTIYPEGESDYSKTHSQMIPKKNKAKSVSTTQTFAYGEVYMYVAGGKMHIVTVQNHELKIYTLSPSLQVKGTKTIKINYEYWGGFYAGSDGNFYVAVGFLNPNESKTKTVIQVIKYNSKWKKVKTASIKGGSGNLFTGIYQPFRAGSCRMDMQGNILYLMTSRLMFQHSDGLRHQSNIAFEINTKTMKAKTKNVTYVSHSFDQYVKFKDGSLYLLNHGDAYPRTLALAMADRYGTKDSTVRSVSLFKFKGKTGDNFTGCKVGGMEVGGKNVLVCGTAQPHGKKIKNVSGFGYGLQYNAFLAIADRRTGKVTFKWLTANNPKDKSVQVSNSKMVKLSDDRFAVLYNTVRGGKMTLNYRVFNDRGKQVCSKQYSDKSLNWTEQPVLYKGNIIWVDIELSGTTTNMKVNSIPAVY